MPTIFLFDAYELHQQYFFACNDRCGANAGMGHSLRGRSEERLEASYYMIVAKMKDKRRSEAPGLSSWDLRVGISPEQLLIGFELSTLPMRYKGQFCLILYSLNSSFSLERGLCQNCY